MSSYFATNWPTLLWTIAMIALIVFQLWVAARREHQTMSVWMRDNWTLLVSVVALVVCASYLWSHWPSRSVTAEAAPAGPRTEMTGFTVIERPATCVYVYTNPNGSSLVAVPKPKEGC